MTATQPPPTETPAPQAVGSRVISAAVVSVVTVLILAASGGAAYWWFVADRGDDEAAEVEDGVIVEVAPLTATLGVSRPHHARVGIAVVLADGVAPEVVDERLPLLQDRLMQHLAESSADELRSEAGTRALRTDLSADAVEIWGGDVVRRVVLTELLID